MNKKSVPVIFLISILACIFFNSAVNAETSPAAVVYEYIPAPGQYTNIAFNKPPIYMKGASSLTAPPDNWVVGASLGSFGGYLTYKLTEPLKNDPANPFGSDFIVYGNGQGTKNFSEPAGVWVAQDNDNDGKPDCWYELAGSMHFENTSVWNYSVTYTRTDSGTAYETSDGKTGVFEKYQYPDADKYTYETAPDPYSMTLAGTLIDEKTVPVFGYADVHPNDAGNIETPLNPYRKGPLFADNFTNDFDKLYHGLFRGDAMDISWAVNSDGEPVYLDEISFVRFVNSSFMQQGALGEKSAEIAAFVPICRTDGEKLPEVSLDSIILLKSSPDGETEEIFPFEKDKFSYEISLQDAAEYKIRIAGNAPENVYINNTRGDEAVYPISAAKEVQRGVYKVRIAAQEGESAPALYYLTFIDKSGGVKINYDADGGEISGEEKISVYYNEEDFGGEMPVPKRENYTFSGWFDGDTKYTVIDASVPHDITLTAKWVYISSNKNDKDIRVSFRLVGAAKSPSGEIDRGRGIYDSEYVTWIPTKKYSLGKGGTAYDLFCIAADSAGIDYTSEKNYITSIKAPKVLGNYRLEEFTNGRRSGWMYTVNGVHPDSAYDRYILKNGDEVVFHYVNDYSYDISDWGGSSLGDRSTWDKWLSAKDIEPEDAGFSDSLKTSERYDILTVGRGGSVSPLSLKKYIGRDVTFTITPDKGYIIKEIIADGKRVEISGNKYTYKNLRKQSRIEINFEKAELPQQTPAITPIPENTPTPENTLQPEKVHFNDVQADHWAEEYIYYLAERGIVSGRSVNEFAPEENITRAEFIKILANISGYRQGISENKFIDVDIDSWYAPVVFWAAENGIAAGVDGEHFLPEAYITREQMTVMIWRYISGRYDIEEKYEEYIFADEDRISEYAAAAVHKIQRLGGIRGRGNNMFEPQGYASRAEAAKTAAWLEALCG